MIVVASVAAGTGFIGLGACASPSPASRERTESTTATILDSPTEGPQIATLPGESIQQLQRRIYSACLDYFGIPYDDTDDGLFIKDPSGELFTDQVSAECENRLRAAGIGARPPSEEELRSYYDDIVDWAQCVHSLGYDLPITGSESEFVASDGNVGPIDPAALLSSLTDAQLDDLYDSCPQY